MQTKLHDVAVVPSLSHVHLFAYDVAVVPSLSHVHLFAYRALQHPWLPCLSLSPRVGSNSRPLSWWFYLTILSYAILFFWFQFFPASGFFPMSLLFIRWPKYWNFSISLSNEYSGLISFRIDWLDLAVQGTLTQESSPAPQFKGINFSALSLPYGLTLTTIHVYWKSHSFDYMDFGSEVMSLLFNMLSSFAIAFLPRIKCYLT